MVVEGFIENSAASHSSHEDIAPTNEAFGPVQETRPQQLAQAETQQGNATLPAAADARPGVETVAVEDNTVKLPAGTSIEKVEVDGDNLVLVQPDGSRVVIEHAALHVPTFVIDDVEIPKEALVAALEASNINVAAGPDGTLTASAASSNSGGGNFGEAIPGIGDAGPAIDLLGPTALQFGTLDEQLLFPALDDPNDAPSVLLFPDPRGGAAGLAVGHETVDEAGLADGTSPDSSEGQSFKATASGTFQISDPDGLGDIASLTINGQSFAIDGLVNQSIIGNFGTLTITEYNPATGVATYKYELTSPVKSPTSPGPDVEEDRDIFTLTVTDKSGLSASAELHVNIVDDVPVASLHLQSEVQSIVVDETKGIKAGDGNAADELASGAPADAIGYAKVSGGELFNTAGTSIGADRVGATTIFSLSIVNGGHSGLYLTGATHDAEHEILLVENNGVIEGRVNGEGAPAFTIAIDAADGSVTVTQYLSLDHPDDASDDEYVSLAGGSLQAVLKVTDGDQDVAIATVEIGNGLIRFEDDGPKAGAVTGAQASVLLDESNGSGSGTDGIPSATIAASSIAALFAAPAYGADGAGSVVYKLSATDGAKTGLWLTGQSGASEIVLVKVSDTTYEGRAGGAGGTLAFTVSINASTGAVTVTQSASLEHTTDGGPGAAHDDSLFLSGAAGVKVVQTVTDGDGDTASATSDAILKIEFQDDGPTLSNVQSQQASNDPNQAPAVGAIHFTPGADGIGSTMTITVNTSGITSAGHGLVTVQNGGVLTAYADNDNSGGYNVGDTAVFTIAVTPGATSYTFDLLAPLDGATSNVSLSSNGSFGSGPKDSIIVKSGVQDIVMVTGWQPTGVFNETTWLSGTNTGLNQTNNVFGSAQGWGLGNGNFDAKEFMRFDFGQPNDYDGPGVYTPPNIALANVTYATFTFDAISNNDKTKFVAHYTDGTSQSFVPINGATTLTITSPAGAQIAWVDAYQSAGKTKLNLTDVGVTSTTTDHTIPVTLQLTDGDGDKTAAVNFSIHVKDGLAPFSVATPVVLDLNHDGLIHVVDLTHSSASFDYDGDGVASKTAWVASEDGILAIDLNGDDTVNNGLEIMFTQHAAGVATDLAALAQLFDTDGDGKLTSADHDFHRFGVWQDANGNGVSDPGEFKTLTALGIAEISLGSDNQHTISADGSVVNYGQSTFTTIDGQTGAVADIGFGNFDGVASSDTGTANGPTDVADISTADTFVIDQSALVDGPELAELITDYNRGEGDVVDLSALLSGVAQDQIGNYVQVVEKGNGAVDELQVSTTGNANDFHTVAVLNTDAGVKILYNDDHKDAIIPHS